MKPFWQVFQFGIYGFGTTCHMKPVSSLQLQITESVGSLAMPYACEDFIHLPVSSIYDEVANSNAQLSHPFLSLV